MRIETVETFLVPPRWLFLRVGTDEGVVGWGEPSLEARAETVRAAIEEMSDVLIGADPRRIDDIWQSVTNGGFLRDGPVVSSAVSGIDQALWDIAGKSLNTPVYGLLGGRVRDRVRMYTWIAGPGPTEIADAAQRAVDAGYTAVKMLGSQARVGHIAPRRLTDDLVDQVAAVRAVLGDDRDVAVDFHGRFSVPMARRTLPLLEEFRPFFIEEPVLPEHAFALGDVVGATPIPIATGERLFSGSEFVSALQAGISVAQPDLSHAGGISEVRRIAGLADTFGATLAPHCPLGPISLAAALQVDIATPNFLIQEQALGLGYPDIPQPLSDIIDIGILRFVDGCLARPTGPGLGADIDETAVRRLAATGHRWRMTPWRHNDGSLAEL